LRFPRIELLFLACGQCDARPVPGTGTYSPMLVSAITPVLVGFRFRDLYWVRLFPRRRISFPETDL